ncbi:hypothetical protein J2751_001187 [Halorubrum alkaliphilum]|uniref:Protein-glutamine gamma-glutamyltransferase-like C-terminal domain-containing protein n=1 Tax=Halorubrum alkaliphilum TaxID=261290 RepID=A0A8T4GFE7_9EURY|nr:DUF4129 domain-containing protein [Halorubrum alkaliphilum]MBP1922181.1 hypothetical protein [Halorubrum alkaliphilum]
MKRETLVAVLLALLAVVALGVAAATLDTAVTVDGGGFGGGEAGSAGPGETADTPSPTASPGGETELDIPELCYEFLWEPPALLVFGLALLGVGSLAYRDTGSLVAGTAVAALVGFPIGLLMYLLSLCEPLELGERTDVGLGGEGNGTLPGSGGGDGGLGSGSGTVSTPEALFVAIVVVAILASLLVLLAASGDDETTVGDDESTPDEPESAEPDLAAVARTAGEAADRIESESAENEVYRAWREMTEVLDVDRPASSTPAEFAAAAVDAGVDEESVTQLTAVFERVRYGGEDPTDDRERRAVEALRRIEEAHGGDR